MKNSWRQCLGWFSGDRATPLLGVDIGVGGVRIVELSRMGQRWRVEHFAKRALPHGAIRDGGIAHPEQVSQALVETLKDCDTRVRQAALALPSGLVIRRVLSLADDLTDEALELQVEADAEQSLPFSLDELSLDFGVIGASATRPGNIDVMLVAARKEKIDERLSLAQAAGLRPVIIDVESQALVAAVELHQSSGISNLANTGSARGAGCALMHIGRDSSQFSVVSRGMLVFERELSVGLHKLDQEVSRRPQQAATATEAFYEVVCQEIRRAIQLYVTAAEHEEITRLLLAGPADKLAMLPAIISDRLALATQLANPFAAMDCSSAVAEEDLLADASSCLVACGLAMLDAQS